MTFDIRHKEKALKKRPQQMSRSFLNIIIGGGGENEFTIHSLC